MTKVRISANWDSSQEITKRLINQFKTSESDVSNIEFVHDESYDIIIFLNYINIPVKPNSKVFVFPNEPIWSGSHQRNFLGVNNVTVFGFDKNYYQPYDCVIESIAYTFYGGRGPWSDSPEIWSYNNMCDFNTSKTKNISSVVTNLKSNNYSECTYGTRYELIEFLINKTDFIDFYGGWDVNVNCKQSPQKIDSVKDYKFCLVLENQFVKNWLTEKFYDCILTNTIPIYYGCQNIKDIYPENGYILLDDINNKDRILEQLIYINNNSEKLYDDMFPELIKIKKKYFEKNNLLKKIKELCNNGI